MKKGFILFFVTFISGAIGLYLYNTGGDSFLSQEWVGRLELFMLGGLVAYSAMAGFFFGDEDEFNGLFFGALPCICLVLTLIRFNLLTAIFSVLCIVIGIVPALIAVILRLILNLIFANHEGAMNIIATLITVAGGVLEGYFFKAVQDAGVHGQLSDKIAGHRPERKQTSERRYEKKQTSSSTVKGSAVASKQGKRSLPCSVEWETPQRINCIIFEGPNNDIVFKCKFSSNSHVSMLLLASDIGLESLSKEKFIEYFMSDDQAPIILSLYSNSEELFASSHSYKAERKELGLSGGYLAHVKFDLEDFEGWAARFYFPTQWISESVLDPVLTTPCVEYCFTRAGAINRIINMEKKIHLKFYWDYDECKNLAESLLNLRKYYGFCLDYHPTQSFSQKRFSYDYQLLMRKGFLYDEWLDYFLFMTGQEHLSVVEKDNHMQLILKPKCRNSEYFKPSGREKDESSFYSKEARQVALFLMKNSDFGAINSYHYRLECVRDAYRDAGMTSNVRVYEKYLEELNSLCPIFYSCHTYGLFWEAGEAIKKVSGGSRLADKAVNLWRIALLDSNAEFMSEYFESANQSLSNYNFMSEYLYFYHHIDKDGIMYDYDGEKMIDKDGRSRSRITRRVPRIEALLVELYVKGKQGQSEQMLEPIVQNSVDHYCTHNRDSSYERELFLLASGLCCLKLYGLEKAAIEKMLPSMQGDIAAQLQNRLNSLNEGNCEIELPAENSHPIYLITESADWRKRQFDEYFANLIKLTNQCNDRLLAMYFIHDYYDDYCELKRTKSLLIKRVDKVIPLTNGQCIDERRINLTMKEFIKDFNNKVVYREESVEALDNPSMNVDQAFPFFEFTDQKNKGVSVLLWYNKFGRTLNVSILVIFTPDIDNGLGEEAAINAGKNVYLSGFTDMLLDTFVSTLQSNDDPYQ